MQYDLRGEFGEIVGLAFAVPLLQGTHPAGRDTDRDRAARGRVFKPALADVRVHGTLGLHVRVGDLASDGGLFSGNNADIQHIGKFARSIAEVSFPCQAHWPVLSWHSYVFEIYEPMSLLRLQELHNDLRGKKDERKKLKQAIKDELKHHSRYAEVIDEAGTLREEKKSIEAQVRESVPQDAARLADLDAEIKADEELMSDLAMGLILKNESVELRDEYENRYLPLLKVIFKKEEQRARSKDD